VGRLAEKEREEPIVECRIIETEDGFVIEAKGELTLGCGPGMAAKVVACC